MQTNRGFPAWQFCAGYSRLADRLSHVFGRIFFGILMLLISTGNSVAAAPPESKKAVLLVMETGQNEVTRKRESAFIGELELALDRFRVVSARARERANGSVFGSLSLSAQMDEVRRLAGSHHAVAVIWLTEDTKNNKTLLHLAALSSGRALIRIVEAENGPSTEVALAMAVDELVGQAYLFDAKNPAAAVEASVISATSREMSESSQPPPPCTTPAASVDNEPRRAFLLEGLGRVGIAGNEGPRLTAGGSLGLQRAVGDHFFLGGGLNLLGGPFEDTSAQQIENLSLAPYIGLGLLHPLGRISIGGGVFISVPWQQTVITLPDTGTHRYTDWNMRAAARFCIRLSFSDTLALALSPELGVWLNQKRYYALSDNRDIVRNPRLDAGLVVGLVLKN